MIAVLDTKGIVASEEFTMKVQHISAMQLMERAAQACTAEVQKRYPISDLVVVAGKGNNGGDGVAMARLLLAEGRNVRVFRVLANGMPSEQNRSNFDAARAAGVRCLDLDEIDSLDLSGDEVVIDALLGNGCYRSPSGLLARVIDRINAHAGAVISIDMPSGLPTVAGVLPDDHKVVVADLVLTLGAVKPTLLFPEFARFVKHWVFVPLGFEIPPDVPGSRMRMLETNDIAAMLMERSRTGHKGTFGHALMVAGGRGHMGAAVLATRAALRSGCGLVTTHVPAGGAQVIHITSPEAMCREDASDAVSEVSMDQRYDAVGIGPGMGTGTGTARVIGDLLAAQQRNCVLDADALNVLAQESELKRLLHPGVVLTPHPREFDRLAGTPSASAKERLRRAMELARTHSCVLVLKGAYTSICTAEGNVLFNTTGNCGMAKGGAGDALTGLITGLLAQGYPPLEAAVVGVHLHGLAGDLAARNMGPDGMTITDLIDHIPLAWQHLRAVQKRSSTEPLP
ncbi:MAG: NAD(P)H-hydrate dehydratase [Flavobacteriales bacterium]|nr:NAD(P)H-hydrate dehydratase [Flavobacteriales bacterium]